jgi:hypothetical protein
MTNLRLQKRLAASIYGCGKRRVWLDPNETSELAVANSRAAVRKLIKDGLILRKPTVRSPSSGTASSPLCSLHTHRCPPASHARPAGGALALAQAPEGYRRAQGAAHGCVSPGRRRIAEPESRRWLLCAPADRTIEDAALRAVCAAGRRRAGRP